MFQITIVLLCCLFTQVALSTRVSLTDSPVYSSMRPCKNSCFGNDDVNYLASDIKCQNINECICRLDMQPSAVKRIKTCVGLYCDKNEVDIGSAVSLYKAYCTGAGYVSAAATTPAGGNGSEGTTTYFSPSYTTTVTVTAVQTVFASSVARRVRSPLEQFHGFQVLKSMWSLLDNVYFMGTMALTIYAGYPAPPTTPSPTNPVSVPAANGSPPQTTLTSTTSKNSNAPAAADPTNANTGTTPQSSGPKISNDTIGIIVGVVGAFFTAIGAYFAWKAHAAYRERSPPSNW